MRSWWLILVLMLSVGINIGLLASRVWSGQEGPGREGPGGEGPGQELPGREGPGGEGPGRERPGTETPGEPPGPRPFGPVGPAPFAGGPGEGPGDAPLGDPLAGPGPRGPGPADGAQNVPGLGRMAEAVDRIADHVGLRGDDRDTFLEVQRQFFESTLRGRQRVHDLQLELRRELTADEPDRDETDRLLAELAAAHAGLERAFVDNLFASRELLDEEQERRFMRVMVRLRQLRDEPPRGDIRPPGPAWRPGPGSRPGFDRRPPADRWPRPQRPPG